MPRVGQWLVVRLPDGWAIVAVRDHAADFMLDAPGWVAISARDAVTGAPYRTRHHARRTAVSAYGLRWDDEVRAEEPAS